MEPNTKVAIVGDSGAGKSTLFQLVTRFYDPTTGEVCVDGHPLRFCTPESVRRNIAYVAQEADLFAVSVMENIVYGKGMQTIHLKEALSILDKLNNGEELNEIEEHVKDEVMAAVESANATDFVDLTQKLGEGGSGLSGGQKQRVAIARAIYCDRKILLLDEVTSALDQISEAIVQEALDNLSQDRSVLVIAHRLHTIMNADTILVMEKGRIVAQGDHEYLMQTCEKYSDMVEAANDGKLFKADGEQLAEQYDKIPSKLV